ncbi:LANO_0A04258g1_1 [Lachancea nothofagi CBS 11611]|uniref:LANO_0A04258g1_1 n=1 Tax=Lachancea nothofagi CBS 11611 TaxID=1266666 RepID=A0A1G4IQJ7_9SACH|nr:LANO_0A04258g1_1 [Lachancea nothofagi CBS 11611]
MTMNTNTKRLSAMIDSFHDERSDELLYQHNSTPGTPLKKSTNSVYGSSPESLSRPPAVHDHGDSGKLNATQNFKFGSPGNRESLISDYSASIHEGVPVYIKSTTANVRKEAPVIYSATNFPLSEETVGEGLQSDRSRKDAAGLENHGPRDSMANLRIEDPNANLRSSLRLSEPKRSHNKKNSSIGSGNLASESGHSHNISALSASMESSAARFYTRGAAAESNATVQPVVVDKEGAEVQEARKSKTNYNVSPERSLTAKSILSSVHDGSDVQSLVSSIVPSLRTNMPDRVQSKLPDRSSTSEYNPSIPPRSSNRPKSHLFIKDGLEDIQNQLQQQMLLGDSQSVSRASTNKSSSYFSAADRASHYSDEEDNFGKPDDDSYLHRPLPSVPAEGELHHSPESISRNDTILIPPAAQIMSEKPPRLPSFPTSIIKNNQTSSSDLNYKTGNDGENDVDDDYEDILDDTFQTPQSPPKTEKKLKKSNHSAPRQRMPQEGRSGKNKTKTKREMRSFDIDTISQMLNVTKGTLIGSEFADLGMKTEEKRALERLVDSLSRLTADMVLDPERFEEGMKRLDKASRALEGF